MSEVQSYSLNEINTKLLEIESELNLLERQSDGVYYWERVRHPVHKTIIKKIHHQHVNSVNRLGSGSTSNSSGSFYSDLKNKSRILAEGFKNVFDKNPFLAGDCDVIFNTGPVPRRRLTDGTMFHLQLDPIAQEIVDSCTFIEPKGGVPYAPSPNRRFLTFPRTLSRASRKLGFKSRLPSEEVNVIEKFETKVENILSIEVDAVSRIEKDLSHRKIEFPLYERVIKTIDPEVCFTTYGHSNYLTFVEACQHHNIPVIDIQHCALNRNYWAYHYPEDRSRHVSPDYFFSWGNYWEKASDLPFEENKIYVTGYPHFEDQMKKFEDSPKNDQVLFISNPNSGYALSEYATRLSKMNVDIDLVYKLHGAEFDSWRDDYPALATVADSNNIMVVDEIEGSLHQLLSESKAQVGVSSTALYEGLGFGLPTFILDSPRAYEMSGVINRGYAERVSEPEEILSSLDAIDSVAFPPSNNFFEQNSLEKMGRAISQIASIESLDIDGVNQ